MRFLLRARVAGENPASRGMRALREEIRRSPRVAALLAGRSSDGRLLRSKNVYHKWHGAHWVLCALADLGYPPGDRSLLPMRDQLLEHWLAPEFFEELECETRAQCYANKGAVPKVRGRYRRCASQQGNALFAIATLGLADARTERLAERLLHWQWPDGGWNCDKDPNADTSSFMETLTPLRGLCALARGGASSKIQRAITRAAQVFLERRLFKRRSTGSVIRREFIALHYPLYWHYDILGGLAVMAEAGFIGDERTGDALDLLASKQLEDGGFPAEARYYRVSKQPASNSDVVGWGPTGRRTMNPWVTTRALGVLAAAGRLR